VRIVNYPHPTLRHKSKPLRRVDAELKKLVRGMFELMYESRGIGLAANQVDLPYRLFVLNLEADPDQGEEFIFINPVILRRSGGSAEAEEGCLSFPDIYAPVRRPEKVVVSAYDLQGQELRYELSGMFSRAFQHEADHLDGVVFIDRLSESSRLDVRDKLAELEAEYAGSLRRGAIPDETRVAERLAELEALRT
jgi:peptide deformylase